MRVRAALALALAGVAFLPRGAVGASSAWLAPSILSAVGRDAPAVALTPGGDAIVAWSKGEAAFRPAGGSFGTVEHIAPPDVTAAPVLGVDGDGDVTAVWGQWQELVSAVRDARSGSWGRRQVIASAPSTSFFGPTLAVAPSGEAIVAWSSHDDVAGKVYASIRPPGGEFGPPQALGAGDAPQVAIDAAGGALVVWTSGSFDDRTIFAAIRTAGSSLSAPVRIGGGGTYVTYLRVAMTPAGDAAVAWLRSPFAANASVEVVRRPAGGAFGAPERLSSAAAAAGIVQLAADARGEFIAVWSEPEIKAAIAPSARAGWSAPQTISNQASAFANGLAANARGDAVALWAQLGSLVVASVRRAGGTFGPATVVSQAGVTALAPTAAVDPQGNAIVAWTIRRGGAQRWSLQGIIEAAGFDAAGPELRALSIPARTRARVRTLFAVAPLDVWSRVASVRWSFGDGSAATGRRAAHAYRRPGRYAVQVTATDAVGHATTARRTVVVVAG